MAITTLEELNASKDNTFNPFRVVGPVILFPLIASGVMQIQALRAYYKVHFSMKRGVPFGAPLKHHRHCTKGGNLLDDDFLCY